MGNKQKLINVKIFNLHTTMAIIKFKQQARRSVFRRLETSDYHLVDKKDVDSQKASKTLRMCELSLRIQKTNRHFNGKIDNRHKHWMKKLCYDVSTEDKKSMSLEELGKMYRYRLAN